MDVLTEDERLGQIAYHAYGRSTNFRNFQGNKMPGWEELPEPIKNAWIASGQAISRAIAAREKVQRNPK